MSSFDTARQMSHDTVIVLFTLISSLYPLAVKEDCHLLPFHTPSIAPILPSSPASCPLSTSFPSHLSPIPLHSSLFHTITFHSLFKITLILNHTLIHWPTDPSTQPPSDQPIDRSTDRRTNRAIKGQRCTVVALSIPFFIDEFSLHQKSSKAFQWNEITKQNASLLIDYSGFRSNLGRKMNEAQYSFSS